MNTMPRINKSAVPTQSDEERAILDGIAKATVKNFTVDEDGFAWA